MSPSKQTQQRELHQRTLTCLQKLSDKDTHSSAFTELSNIASSLPLTSIQPFLSSISATDSSDKSPVRRTCLKLITILSTHHKDSLSPHLPKLLLSVSKRLRDPDSSVRTACVSASRSLVENLSNVGFESFSKPFIDALFSEQDFNAISTAALCLQGVVEGFKEPDVGSLRRVLVRLERLVKCEGFKGKSAVLGLMGSIVGVEGVVGGNMVKCLVGCFMGFLGSEDWGTRKGAAEALIRIGEVGKGALVELKGGCLSTFEAKRFDKVKAVRETMHKMIEVWREIPDLADQVSPPRESQASCKDASDGRYPPGYGTSVGSCTPQVKNRNSLDSTTRKRSPLSVNENKKGAAMFRKLDRKKPSNCKSEITVAPVDNSPGTVISEDNTVEGDGRVLKSGGIRRSLFDQNCENGKLGVLKNGSRVFPCPEASVRISTESADMVRNHRESEELSLIHKQLIHIENQQANLFDLLQRYIGSSQNGMMSLEARVHGLELALDEISYDLSMSNGRMSQQDTSMCCKLPGTDFLSSKLRKKTELQPSASRLPSSSLTPSSDVPNENVGAKGFPLRNRRYNQFQGGHGHVTNPLAEIHRGSHGLSEASSSGKV